MHNEVAWVRVDVEFDFRLADVRSDGSDDDTNHGSFLEWADVIDGIGATDLIAGRGVACEFDRDIHRDVSFVHEADFVDVIDRVFVVRKADAVRAGDGDEAWVGFLRGDRDESGEAKGREEGVGVDARAKELSFAAIEGA